MTNRTLNMVFLMSLASAALACGESDGGSGGGGGGRSGGGGRGAAGGSLDAIAAGLESPTGTVTADNVPDIAAAFEDAEGAGGGVAFASRIGAGGAVAERKQTEIDYGYLCPVSGDATANASNDGRMSTITYDECCSDYTGLVTCCQTGRGTSYYSGSTTAPSATEGVFDFCMEFDLRTTCGDESDVLDSAVCYDGVGNARYLIHVDGASFAVEGDYFDGYGSLEISGVNGTYECEWSGGVGTCVGSDGSRFDV